MSSIIIPSSLNTLSEPYVSNKTCTTSIISFKIQNVWVVPYISATLYIILRDDSGGTYPRTLVLTNTDYSAWSSDDAYLTKYCNECIHTIFNS